MKIILALLVFTVSSSRSTSTPEDHDQKIQNLETEKREILQLVDKGIRDAVSTLQKSNDSDASQGISYMKELRDKIPDFNISGNAGFNNSGEISLLANDTRRQKEQRKIHLDNNMVMKLLDKKKKTKKYEERREEMEKRIEAWVQERMEEKGKLKEKLKKKYEQTIESCPDTGLKNRGVKNKGVQYPCCRKCCKKSYLGCL